MCGIVGIFKIKQQTQELRQKALKMSQKLRHRGPDWSGIYVGDSAILARGGGAFVTFSMPSDAVPAFVALS